MTTDTPANEIEWFGPEEEPFGFQIKSDHDLEHEKQLSNLKLYRRQVFDMGNSWARYNRDLGDLFAVHSAALVAALNGTAEMYKKEVEDINEAAFIELGRLDAAFPCHINHAYITAKHKSESGRRELIVLAQERRDSRLDDIIAARELMHRQMIMHAYTRNAISWNPDTFFRNGVFQGLFKQPRIEDWRLVKSPEDDSDGVYRLTMVWTPGPQANSYPIRIAIDRTDDGNYAVENIEWALFTSPCHRKTRDVTVKIRCSFVAGEQCRERVARERTVIREKKYKRSLTFWQRLFYKAGDYQESQSPEPPIEDDY